MSDQPIELRTGEGSIQAGGVSVAERGKRVLFTSGVKVVFVPNGELMSDAGERTDEPEAAE